YCTLFQPSCSGKNTILYAVPAFLFWEEHYTVHCSSLPVLGGTLYCTLFQPSCSGRNTILYAVPAFLFWEEHSVPPRFREVDGDHKRMLALLRDSDRTWVAVCPPHITEGPGRGDYTVARGQGPGRTITKQDLGHFLVTCLTDPANYGQLCGLCDAPQ
ncbi:flavin reductase (NADPH), partial [Hyalella azteca]|uniref:Flavin reductase (NADPH) n=1 Tax=Hyalella azteca TaxID=294128 RepID=A0A8B7MZP6_HYAAZ